MKIFGFTVGGEKDPGLTTREQEIAKKQELMNKLTQVNAWLTKGVGLSEIRRAELIKEKEELEKALGMGAVPVLTNRVEPTLPPLTQSAPEPRDVGVEDAFEAVAAKGNKVAETKLSNETTPDFIPASEPLEVGGTAAAVNNTQKAALENLVTSGALDPHADASVVAGAQAFTERVVGTADKLDALAAQNTPTAETSSGNTNNTDGKTTLHYSIGGKDQTFVVGGENQLPNLNSTPAYTSAPAAPSTPAVEGSRGESETQAPTQERTISTTIPTAAPVVPAAPNASTPTPTPRIEWHNDQNEHHEEALSQEKIRGYVSRAVAKGYPENIFASCGTEEDIVHAMGGYMKEKYYDLGYPHDLFTTCNTPIEVKNTAIAYRENLVHERALEEQNRLARVAGLRAGEGTPASTGTQEVRRPLVTPEALAVQERVAAVRDAQEERVSSRKIPGGWWSRNKEKVTGTAGILGGALGIAALAFCLFGKTCTVPTGGEQAAPVAAPVAAAVQDCQKQKEIKVVKKKIAHATAPKQTAAATVSVRETVAAPTTTVVAAPQPVVTAVPSTDVVTAVPSAPQGFRETLPQSIPMAQASGVSATTVYQTTVWNPGSSSYYKGGDTTYVYNNGSSGGGSGATAPRPGTMPVGGTTPIQPPQVKPPVPGPVTGGTGGVQVPPPVGGPSVGGPSIGAPVVGAPISGGVNGPRPNTSAPTVNAPIMGGGYSGGVPNIGAPSGGGSFGNSGAPIVRPPTVNAPISNGSYSNNSSYSSGGSFVGGPSFGGSNGAPMVSAPNVGRPVSGGAPIINTQTGGSSQPSVSGPKFGTR